MTTLAQDAQRSFELGTINELPVIAGDVIYEGAAVGIVSGSGYARPLVAGDAFVGFAETQADNAAGAAGDKHVRVRAKGSVELPIATLVITDVGADIYASDDDTFTKTVGANSFLGRVTRFVSAGVGIVTFDTLVTS